jgi:peroxin-2
MPKAETTAGKINLIRRSLASFPSPLLRILRASQLDAELLDTEISSMLKEQLWQAFAFFRVQHLILKFFARLAENTASDY